MPDKKILNAIKNLSGEATELINNCSAADVNVVDEEGNTPLHYAAKQQNPELILNLINHGARLNIQNKLGETPLFIAVSLGSEPLTKLLLENGADGYVFNERRENCLHVIAKHSYWHLIDYFLEYRNLIFLRDEKGKMSIDYINGTDEAAQKAKEKILSMKIIADSKIRNQINFLWVGRNIPERFLRNVDSAIRMCKKNKDEKIKVCLWVAHPNSFYFTNEVSRININVQDIEIRNIEELEHDEEIKRWLGEILHREIFRRLRNEMHGLHTFSTVKDIVSLLVDGVFSDADLIYTDEKMIIPKAKYGFLLPLITGKGNKSLEDVCILAFSKQHPIAWKALYNVVYRYKTTEASAKIEEEKIKEPLLASVLKNISLAKTEEEKDKELARKSIIDATTINPKRYPLPPKALPLIKANVQLNSKNVHAKAIADLLTDPKLKTDDERVKAVKSFIFQSKTIDSFLTLLREIIQESERPVSTTYEETVGDLILASVKDALDSYIRNNLGIRNVEETLKDFYFKTAEDFHIEDYFRWSFFYKYDEFAGGIYGKIKSGPLLKYDNLWKKPHLPSSFTLDREIRNEPRLKEDRLETDPKVTIVKKPRRHVIFSKFDSDKLEIAIQNVNSDQKVPDHMWAFFVRNHSQEILDFLDDFNEFVVDYFPGLYNKHETFVSNNWSISSEKTIYINFTNPEEYAAEQFALFLNNFSIKLVWKEAYCKMALYSFNSPNAVIIFYNQVVKKNVPIEELFLNKVFEFEKTQLNAEQYYYDHLKNKPEILVPLLQAAYERRCDAVIAVVDELIKSNTININQQFGGLYNSFLHDAITSGSMPIIEFFLAKNINLELRNGFGVTAISMLGGKGIDVQFAQQIIIKIIDSQPTQMPYLLPKMLMQAIDAENMSIIDFCLQQKDFNINQDLGKGNTFLHGAYMLGKKAVVEKLLAAGADPQKKNKAGKIPAQCVPKNFDMNSENDEISMKVASGFQH